MKFSRSQYPIDEKTYVLEKTETNGKIIGRFVIPEFGILPFRSIYLKYSAGPGEGGKRNFRMNLWDGNIFSAEHVKTEKGTISRHDRKINKEYEEKVKNMIKEALKLSEE
jgi:hypothetical protein